MKRLYLLRHGKAVSRMAWDGDDGSRPLTSEGETAMWREAEALKRLGLAPDVVITSPLVRARRTAEIVAETLGVTDRLVEDERLAHGFDARTLARIVDPHDGAQVMVVGHEPAFSTVVAELIGGGTVALKKGGVARVDLDADLKHGELAWLLTPGLLGVE